KEPGVWVAALFKNQPAKKTAYQSDKTKDSLKQVIDSLLYVINTAPGAGNKDSVADHGRNNQLLLINTATGTRLSFSNISEYTFDKKGTHLLLEQTLNLKDTAGSSRIIRHHLNTNNSDTLLRGGNDFKNLVLSDDGSQAAFIVQRNAKRKALVQ